MTKNWISFISHLRVLVMCFAVMIYGLPITTAHAASEMTMASADMMDHEMSVDCAEPMTDHSPDMPCCDEGDCDYSCASLTMAMTDKLISPLEIPSQAHLDRFTNHLTSIGLTSDSPPPQA